MSTTRLFENEITPDAVGRLLVRYSHTGEDPDPRANPERRMDDVTEGGYAPIRIAAVRQSDADNVVAVLCGALMEGAVLGEDGRPVKRPDGSVIKGPLVPPEGEIEVGIGQGGWIEVDDGS
jgi:hypothetical protein